MSEPRQSQNAARLSEDIGDVLSAIRRLIAEDEALTNARQRLDAERGALTTAIDEDAGDFLARRYGGNAAMARELARSGQADEARIGYQRPDRLAEAVVRSDAQPATRRDADEAWPLGGAANGPGAARPRVDAGRKITRHEQDQPTDPAHEPEVDIPRPFARNDLARTLSAATRPIQPTSAGTPSAPRLNAVPASRGTQTATTAPPLRLDAARRVLTGSDGNDSSTWRAWRQPTGTAPAQPDAASRLDAASEVVGDDDDFAEAFDWKARMRPEITPTPNARAATAAAVPSEVKTPSEEPTMSLPTSALADTEDDVADRAEGCLAEPGQTASDPDSDFDHVIAAMERADAAIARNARHRGGAAPQEGVEQGAPARPAADQQAAATASPHETVTGLPPEEEEQSIRDLLREMIQEELHGELGERFSRNLRAVIRREVAAAIEDQIDRL